MFDKCDSNQQNYRQELIPHTKSQPFRVFVRNDLVDMKTRSHRVSSKIFLELKEKF